MVSRPEPAPAYCSLTTERRTARRLHCTSGAKQRRYPAVSPSNSSTVPLLLADVDNILKFETIPFFYPKIRRLGPSNFQIENIPVILYISGLHKQMLSFLGSKHINLKLGIEPPIGCFLSGSGFDPIAFSSVQFAKRNDLPMRKNRSYCLCKDSSKRRDQQLLLWSAASKRRAECAALRAEPKRPTPC